MSAANPATSSIKSVKAPDASDAWLRVVAEKIRDLRHGTIHIKVHESQVVLVERVEQTRFDLAGKSRPS